METFYRTHSYLVEHTNAPVRRDLMDEIDWNDRLIGIKGTRGVGKTTFLLQYAKEKFGTDRSCLFINMNNFYFSKYTLVDFAGEFVKRGGKVLLIDQVFKYPEWSHDLRACYEKFPGLKIVFTGSSVMRLKEENPELSGIVKVFITDWLAQTVQWMPLITQKTVWLVAPALILGAVALSVVASSISLRRYLKA